MNTFEILSAWGMASTQREAMMINLVAGTIMSKLGERSIEITADDVQRMMQNNEVVAVPSDNGGYSIRLIAKGGTIGDTGVVPAGSTAPASRG